MRSGNSEIMRKFINLVKIKNPQLGVDMDLELV